ncbi:MAG: hypothetical protein AAFY76_10235, partial [Cyanobacteria bacterium J06649_11]
MRQSIGSYYSTNNYSGTGRLKRDFGSTIVLYCLIELQAIHDERNNTLPGRISSLILAYTRRSLCLSAS